MQFKTLGIVLKEQNYNDNDRLLSILTKDAGVVFAWANGARGMKNKLSYGSDLFSYCEWVFYKSKERYIVNSIDVQNLFYDIRKDVEVVSLASYLAELAAELSPREEPSEDFFRLFLNSLYFIENRRKDLRLVKSVFELRMLSLAGYMPDLVGCEVCGCVAEDGMRFNLQSGSLCCEDCKPPAEGELFLSPAVLAAMRHIAYSDFEKLFSFTCADTTLDALSAVTEKYLQNQLGRSFDTLAFYKSLAGFGV